MKSILIYAMIYLGSALMVWNIYGYICFAKPIREHGDWQREERILRLPILLLVLFLCGYLAVGLFGRPDLVIASILLGGSVFVFAMLLLIRRVVERIRQNEHMEAALEAAERANAAKTFFLSNMSHDLRTPLNAIIGYTTLANREGVCLKEAQEYLQKIEGAGRQLLDIVNDVLEMSRIESGKVDLEPAPEDLDALVRRTADLVSPQMDQKGIRFTVDCAVTERWVLCDRAQLSRALMNMLSNACKFTGDGGEVSLTLRETDRSSDSAAFEFRVRDNGIGMSPEFAQRIFTPFERERTSSVSKIQGTGLGMSITKSFVDLMGGSIDVNTKQGEGTEFVMRLSFPLTAPGPERAGTAESNVEHGHAGLRLLLVEDNPVNREIASLLLTRQGFALDTAEDGQAAVERVQQAPPGAYAAVLMDIQMPVMDGYAAARAIRALPDPGRASVPIIAMTANAFREDEQAARDAGMQGHIAKPLDLEKMMETIDQVLSEE